jgi:hypothetical protein
VKFNWRSRSRNQLLEALQHELAHARSELEASLADAVAVMEGRLHKDLEQREKTTQELSVRLDSACSAFENRELDLLHALTRVADACDAIAMRVEVDSQERKALIGALEVIADSLDANAQAAIGPRDRDRVTGGTIAPAPPLDLTDDEVDAPQTRHPWGSRRP